MRSGAWRGVQLVGGLFAFALSMALLMASGQGAMPWDVLHQGVARTSGVPVGVVVALTSVVVMLLWIPLRQRPGVGTLANLVIVAVAIDPMLALVHAVAPAPGIVAGITLALAGIVLNGVATAAYVGVHLGPGPRDGLMTGLCARTGWRVGPVKTAIEVVVVLAGWALGGTLGWATLAYALGVGAVVQVALPWCDGSRRRTTGSGHLARPADVR
ncbi:putative membrane protein YczE [Sediminihabitans luteus]|uniref:Putative membrane protein YczE n=2 Tax=Sediminihabitans luteus TaxID=1138585 RepID=A0A2M9CQB0_9CELL|nr:putative membrane protein YczE [Sediminihabitans luteus]GII98057.1 membrane protein [Sediminihabitans luteus]